MNAVEKRRWFRFTERRLSIAAIVVLVMIAVFLYDRMCFHYANYLALHARASELAAERDQWKSQANTWEDEALHSREFNGADEASIAAPSSVVPPFAVPPVAVAGSLDRPALQRSASAARCASTLPGAA